MTATALIPDSIRHDSTRCPDQGCALATTSCLPTGYAELDLLLPGGGWPTGTLSEIYVERSGIGELQLLMPAAATLTQDGRGLAMVSPPTMPYTPALAARGVQLQHVLILRSQPDDKQAATSEQLLFSGNCGMLLLWHDHLQERLLQRLQHAAERSGALVVLYRSRRAQPFSGAALRLHVSRNDGRTVINVLKRNSGGTSPPVQLDLHGSLTRRPAALQLPLITADQPCFQHTH
jgi:hypothetical protein